MNTKTITRTFEYTEFEVGERVRAASPRCVLPEGQTFIVTRFIPPCPEWGELDGTLFVEGREHGLSCECVTAANETPPPAVTRQSDLRPAPEVLRAVMRHLCLELSRAYANASDAEDEAPLTPFERGSGDEFRCETFVARAFDENIDFWQDPEADDPVVAAPPQFEWRDVRLWWHKHAIRGLQSNRPLSNDEIAQMCVECVAAIDAWDRAHDDIDAPVLRGGP